MSAGAIVDFERFKKILSSGIGFTRTCQECGLSPKKVSEYLKCEPEKLQELNDALSDARDQLYDARERSIADDKPAFNTQKINSMIDDFENQIWLWGLKSSGTVGVNEKDTGELSALVDVWTKCKHAQDIATSMGWTFEEFNIKSNNVYVVDLAIRGIKSITIGHKS